MHHTRESIRANKEAIAWQNRGAKDIHFDIGAGADRACEHAGARDAVVAGQLLEHRAAQPVKARIADMAADELGVRPGVERDRCYGRAHASLGGVGLGGLPNGQIGGRDGAGHGIGRKTADEGFDGDPARDVASGVASHAVRHRKEADIGPDGVRVFIATTLLAEVTRSAGIENHTSAYRGTSGGSKAGITLAPTKRMLSRMFVFMLIVSLTACKRNPEESAVSQPAPPPAAALARPGMTLDQSLMELEKELSMAIGTGMDGAAEPHILRAEAITDRLLETELPFTWLKGNAYSLDSWVRQIQALADRVVAQMRSGVDQGTITRDVTELRGKVIGLRQSLALGGGNPPPSLDSLLAGHEPDSAVTTDESGE